MLMTLVTLAVAAANLAARTDTSFAVPHGSRLTVSNFGGTISVKAWGRSAVRIEAVHPEIVHVWVGREGTSYDVRTIAPPGPPPRVDYQVSAPAWMSLNLDGVYTDLVVEGWKSDVLARTVRGQVKVSGGEGLIRLSAIDGTVDAGGARGRVQVNAVNGGVSVRDAEGEITVEAVNGNVMLERVRSRMVEAATVTGDVRYLGYIQNAGRYRFTSHAGNVDVELPEHPDATVRISTFRGGFESAFPVPALRARHAQNFSFTLGNGDAAIDLESFEGMIRLARSTGSSGR